MITTTGDIVVDVKERQILLLIEAMIFADQPGTTSRVFPQLEGVRSLLRHQCLIALRTVRMGKLRGPKRYSALHTQGVWRNRIFERDALIG